MNYDMPKTAYLPHTEKDKCIFIGRNVYHTYLHHILKVTELLFLYVNQKLTL